MIWSKVSQTMTNRSAHTLMEGLRGRLWSMGDKRVYTTIWSIKFVEQNVFYLTLKFELKMFSSLKVINVFKN